MKYLLMIFFAFSTLHATSDEYGWNNDGVKNLAKKTREKLIKIERHIDEIEFQYSNDRYLVYRLRELVYELHRVKKSLQKEE